MTVYKLSPNGIICSRRRTISTIKQSSRLFLNISPILMHYFSNPRNPSSKSPALQRHTFPHLFPHPQTPARAAPYGNHIPPAPVLGKTSKVLLESHESRKKVTTIYRSSSSGDTDPGASKRARATPCFLRLRRPRTKPPDDLRVPNPYARAPPLTLDTPWPSLRDNGALRAPCAGAVAFSRRLSFFRYGSVCVCFFFLRRGRDWPDRLQRRRG